MRPRFIPSFVLTCMLIGSTGLFGDTTPKTQSLSLSKLTPFHVQTKPASYHGQDAIEVWDTAPRTLNDAVRFALVEGSSFENGTIEVDVSGDTAPDAPPELRGFVGIVFRAAGDGSRFECLYLRPKNGRSEDQLQRNHSTQYISMPGFSWQKLRTESPGKYESYVDLVPGAWTHLKIVVAGTTARLYVNGAPQPALIVNDLKQYSAAGAIGLWIGPGTIAHFTNLQITR